MSTSCRVCHRPLSNPKSIAAGIGPVCASRELGQCELFGDRQSVHVERGPFTGDVVLERTVDGRPVANVEQREALHSPDGFEWGYEGSGPADLAFNVLLRFTHREEAYTLHQEFKRRFLAQAPVHGCVIRESEIRAFIQAHRRQEFHDVPQSAQRGKG